MNKLTMNKFITYSLPFMLMAGHALLAAEGVHKETVRLSPEPKMRVVDRDWSFFKAVPCSLINKTAFHSRSEEMLVAKRKSQCLGKYDAFFSKPVAP